MQLADRYPGGTAKGGDYISGAALGEIIDDPTKPPRPERVIVTDINIDYEGRLCFGEKTVRHMAHLLGMYAGEEVEALVEREALLANALQALGKVLSARDMEIAQLEATLSGTAEPEPTPEDFKDLLMEPPVPRLVDPPAWAHDLNGEQAEPLTEEKLRAAFSRSEGSDE